MKQLKSQRIVVSNRLPVILKNHHDQLNISRSTGGLASALSGVQAELPFTWVGWPGTYFPQSQYESIQKELLPHDLVAVFLNQQQEKQYYHHFCNSILWPLFHYFTDRMMEPYQSWKTYQEVNQLFAETILNIADQGATVWVHDFHLMLLPEILKKQRPDLKIGFFLHIPFPSSEIYRLFPQREDLLKGILGADYIGMHTIDYLRHFRSACQRVLGLDTHLEGISCDGRDIGIGVHPIGMDIQSFNTVLKKKNYAQYTQEIKAKYQNLHVILGVERLDYTKGISHKLDAFERFLEKNPKLIGSVVLLQVIVPCRDQSQEYQAHRSAIEKKISRINGKYSKPGFVPVQYIYRNLPLHELIALYGLASVCMVTPLRDGMNLVALEYVYCAHTLRSPGALILSEFAGASHHLPCTFMVNPLDIDQMASSILDALNLSPITKSIRLEKMSASIEMLNSPVWAKQFLSKLHDHVGSQNSQLFSVPFTFEKKAAVLQRAFECPKRHLFLDYDGSLKEMAPSPILARPSQEIIDLLNHLSCLPNTEVHLVSGRDHQTLNDWFGDLPIHLSAEHGYMNKAKDQSEWIPLKEIDISWMGSVRPILERTVEEVPGSFLEVKGCSLCWHYRLADVDYGPWRAKELMNSLTQDIANMPIEALKGKKIIEVRSLGVSKGTYIELILSQEPQNTFALCLGDDQTDLDMYQALPSDGIAIHVGNSCEEANYHLASPEKSRRFLKEFSQTAYLDQKN